MSTGMQGVVREALSWVVVAAGLALVLLNFDTIRAFNAALIGIPPPGQERDEATASREQTATRVRSGDTVELRSGGHGHYQTDAEINSRDIPVLVDTGASMVVLTYEDAERAGIYVRPSDFTATSRTANGTAKNAPVTLDRVCIDSICVRDVQAMVAEPGRLHVTLLGMTFLGRLSRVDMRSGTLVLQE
ncbi:MAG: TIGR02281 family clan AA aspartic protease [Hyphomicrobiaceae bacterium]